MTNRRLKAVHGLWLGIALLLHSALLLVPIHIPPEVPPAAEIITVTLATQSNAEPPGDQPVKKQPEITPETIPEINPEKKPLSVASEPKDSQLVESLQLSTPALPKSVTTAQLLRSVSHLKLPLPEKEKPLELGAFMAPPLPANWSPGLKIEDNLFSGSVASAGSEIVDQWGDAGGRYNVVVKTSSGHTLCGQTQAWSSMNPLVEPVMMWRSCGGNGKRTSKGLR